MNNAMPATPSLPTMATSADAPSIITYSSEAMAVAGKQARANRAPAS